MEFMNVDIVDGFVHAMRNWNNPNIVINMEDLDQLETRIKDALSEMYIVHTMELTDHHHVFESNQLVVLECLITRGPFHVTFVESKIENWTKLFCDPDPENCDYNYILLRETDGTPLRLNEILENLRDSRHSNVELW